MSSIEDKLIEQAKNEYIEYASDLPKPGVPGDIPNGTYVLKVHSVSRSIGNSGMLGGRVNLHVVGGELDGEPTYINFRVPVGLNNMTKEDRRKAGISLSIFDRFRALILESSEVGPPYTEILEKMKDEAAGLNEELEEKLIQVRITHPKKSIFPRFTFLRAVSTGEDIESLLNSITPLDLASRGGVPEDSL